MHLKSPGIVGRSHAEGDAAPFQIFIDNVHIVDTKPNPRTSAALAASAEIDSGAIAIHRSEVIRAPSGVAEPERSNIKRSAVSMFSTRRIG